MNTPTRNSAVRANGLVVSRARYRSTIMSRLVQAATLAWLAIAEVSAFDGEPLLIRADRAWEPAPEVAGDDKVLNLEGNFEMRGPDWRLTADSAQVHGPVEDPERLVILGTPARVSLIRRNGERASGTGERITYWRRRELVEVDGTAAFATGDLAVTSSKIIYDVDKERLESVGDEGVTVVLREH
ncbi:MAG: hypothetical protein F4171_11280 [Gammaproteobacteria bacterium]|nr:hypothetical protein [Gammaproteobacteria bacterium]MYG13356.1 hypothetical protein [Gammaproteobacteria bacterium]MYK29658.1 hypothetical protein [Gammaproteobacteria bacterium]